MTPELKAKWLNDLRSGKYQKTHSHLRDDKGYCCLGVLCETAGVGFNLASKTADHNADVAGQMWTMYPNDFEGMPINEGEELSAMGMEIFGLGQVQHDDLTRLNDENSTFAEVIQYIEENL